MRRIAIYCFYEKTGRLNQFNLYYLKALQQQATRVIFVANGHLQESAQEKLLAQGIDVIVRPNEGFDFAAWKEAINGIGDEELLNTDELILCNNSCYGPVVPFDTIWKHMDAKPCDFWGLYEHPEVSWILRHLQSYFLVLKNPLFTSQHFKKYLDNLSVAKTWQEAVLHEINFTQAMEKGGFKSASFLSGVSYIANPTCHLPELLLGKGFPLIKRKVFTLPHNEVVGSSLGHGAMNVLRWLEKESDYPVAYIIEDLCTQLPASALSRVFGLVFPLSGSVNPITEEYVTQSERQVATNRSVACICFSFYADLIDYNLLYLKHLPTGSTVVIVTTKPELIDVWKATLNTKPELKARYQFQFRTQPNRGCNESAYWVTCRDIVESWDYICCLHDKKSPAAATPIFGYEWYRHCCEHLLGSSQSVEEILALFESKPWLGLIEPIEPLFANLQNIILAQPWSQNFELGKGFYESLQLTVPFDDKPRAPWGGMFWIRGKAMSALYRKDWSYADFPAEPLSPDGTLLHVLERMYPSIVQESGYLTAQVVLAERMGHYYANLYELAQAMAQGGASVSPGNLGGKTLHFPYLRRQIGRYLVGKLTGKEKVKTREIKRLLRNYWQYKVHKIRNKRRGNR